MTRADEVPTALVLRGGGLGDVLTAVPALRTLRAGLPDHRVVFAGPRPAASLLAQVGIVDDVVPVTTRRLRPHWSGPAPDVAVNLHGCGPQSHQALTSLRPRRLVAFACAAAGHVDGPQWEAGGPGDQAGEPEPQRDRWVRLAATVPAPPCHDHTIPLPPHPHADAAPPVVLHPGASSGARRWPAARFAAVAATLARHGHRIVVTGSADESRLVGDVVAMAAHPAVRPRVGVDLWRFARFVAGASLVICGDTGVGHLAAALRRPSVHLMGPSHPREWGPPPGPHRVLWAGRTGDPQALGVDPGLLRIGVPAVLEAADELLAGPDAVVPEGSVA